MQNMQRNWGYSQKERPSSTRRDIQFQSYQHLLLSEFQDWSQELCYQPYHEVFIGPQKRAKQKKLNQKNFGVPKRGQLWTEDLWKQKNIWTKDVKWEAYLRKEGFRGATERIIRKATKTWKISQSRAYSEQKSHQAWCKLRQTNPEAV